MVNGNVGSQISTSLMGFLEELGDSVIADRVTWGPAPESK
jgi:hypothetical protein